jgi:hypothetical protein
VHTYLLLHEQLSDEDVIVEAVDHVSRALARQAVEGDVERVDCLVLLQHTREMHHAWPSRKSQLCPHFIK